MNEDADQRNEVFFALLAGFVAVLLSLCPYAFPDATFLHSSSYACFMGLALIVLIPVLFQRCRHPRHDLQSYAFAISLGGALLAGVCGLICCLIDPDTRMLNGQPGQTLSFTIASVKARFPLEQSSVGREAPPIALIDAAGNTTALSAAARISLGSYLLTQKSMPSATVVVSDGDKRPLTVTRPTSGPFLSPLLTFPQSTAIAGVNLPSDSFAIPARGRVVLAFLVDEKNTHTAKLEHATGGQTGLLLAEDRGDGQTMPGGIAFAAHATTTTVGDLRIKAVLGVFPAIVVTSVPPKGPMFLGIFAYAIAGGVAVRAMRAAKATTES